jgi:hypothetical protein
MKTFYDIHETNLKIRNAHLAARMGLTVPEHYKPILELADKVFISRKKEGKDDIS